MLGRNRRLSTLRSTESKRLAFLAFFQSFESLSGELDLLKSFGVHAKSAQALLYMGPSFEGETTRTDNHSASTAMRTTSSIG